MQPGQDLPRKVDDRFRDTGRLLVSCPDRPGIVAAVSRFLYERGANITESQQYSTDPFGGTFFLRVEFHRERLDEHVEGLTRSFGALADDWQMRFQLARADELKRVAIFVSTAGHVLQELLWRAGSGELTADIRMVVSNHRDLESVVTAWGIPFHWVPVTRDHKAEMEAAQLTLLGDDVDLVVLARYMQVLTPRFLARFPNRVINIHHSFLPAFVGANPYNAAFDRGVKLIGATAHYVTEELDAGPIIEQDIVRVDHRQRVEDLKELGRHVERAVLARAVQWHLDDRILVHKNKTIVFA